MRLALSILLVSGHLAAQTQPAAPAPASASVTAEPAAAACFPACRDGYTCHRGQCVSLCNPACPAGLECVDGRRCEPPLPPPAGSGRPYEPPPPPRKSFEDLSHTLVGFHWGLPGKLERDGVEQDLDTTLGFNLRADTPVAKYVLLGPQLQFGSWRPDVKPEADHSYYVDLDLVLRLRLPITTSRFNYQVWLGTPIGLTLNVPADDLGKDANMGLGWNYGVLFGGAVHFSQKFGVFAEVGWEQHRFAHARETLPDIDVKLQQALLNLGFVIRN